MNWCGGLRVAIHSDVEVPAERNLPASCDSAPACNSTACATTDSTEAASDPSEPTQAAGAIAAAYCGGHGECLEADQAEEVHIHAHAHVAAVGRRHRRHVHNLACRSRGDCWKEGDGLSVCLMREQNEQPKHRRRCALAETRHGKLLEVADATNRSLSGLVPRSFSHYRIEFAPRKGGSRDPFHHPALR
jgi:hypothetical protein